MCAHVCLHVHMYMHACVRVCVCVSECSQIILAFGFVVNVSCVGKTVAVTEIGILTSQYIMCLCIGKSV